MYPTIVDLILSLVVTPNRVRSYPQPPEESNIPLFSRKFFLSGRFSKLHCFWCYGYISARDGQDITQRQWIRGRMCQSRRMDPGRKFLKERSLIGVMGKSLDDKRARLGVIFGRTRCVLGLRNPNLRGGCTTK
jgi:hypothetical protein